MARYRKKPVEVEIEGPYTGKDWGPLCKFTAWQMRILCVEGVTSLQVWNTLETCYVTVPVGHYIVQGVKGEFYPIDPEVLVSTYERVDIPLDTPPRAD